MGVIIDVTAAATDRGKVRRINEDALVLAPEYRVYAVADGVGGQNAGDCASRLAVEEIREYVRQRPPVDLATEIARNGYLTDCLFRVNRRICGESAEHPEKNGMATTLVLLLLTGATAGIIYIGDSRAYCLHDGELTQLTEDHTYVNELVRQGMISQEQARKHPERNLITRALGCAGDAKSDYIECAVSPGDRLLLCTDGLYNELEDEEIQRIIGGRSSPAEAVEELVETANNQGGHDNITVVLIEISHSEDSQNAQGEQA